jgi:hypothetical protein
MNSEFDDFIKARRQSFLAAENKARLTNPNYSIKTQEQIDKATMQSWGVKTLSALNKEWERNQ